MRSSTTGSACTRPWATAPRPRRGPAWKGSPCARPRDVLIPPLHSSVGGPALDPVDHAAAILLDLAHDRPEEARPVGRRELAERHWTPLASDFTAHHLRHLGYPPGVAFQAAVDDLENLTESAS